MSSLGEIEQELKDASIDAHAVARRLDDLHQQVAQLMVEARIAGERAKRRNE